MRKFFLFIKKIYVLLLFLLFESLALHYYANSSSYSRAQILTSSNKFVGGIYGGIADVGEYFHLRRDNRVLVAEVVNLRNELASYREEEPSVKPKFKDELTPYFYTSGRVVNNSFSRQENYITVKKGMLDDVKVNMAMLTPDGAVAGYILACSDNYSVGMSILNRNFKTIGQFKNSSYFGSVQWDGKDHEHVVLTEIPKYAEITAGDTIVTNEYSTIFPPNMMIGTVVEWELINGIFYEVKLKLAADMSTLNHVLLVGFRDAMEKSLLEEQAENQNTNTGN